TRIGGSSAERIESVAVDLEGAIYVAGSTGSRDFPVTPEAFQESCVCTNQGRDNPDVFVAKLDASGDRLIYASYLGGSEPDRPTTIAIDDMGRAYVAGTTVSPDFPVVRPFQDELAGDVDAFVAKISATGRSVAYASYLGGSLGGY